MCLSYRVRLWLCSCPDCQSMFAVRSRLSALYEQYCLPLCDGAVCSIGCQLSRWRLDATPDTYGKCNASVHCVGTGHV